MFDLSFVSRSKLHERETCRMNDIESLKHSRWECKYHVVFIPKYRKKAIYGEIRKELGAIFHELAKRKESKIEEGHLMRDHVHILVSIPPKHSVAQVIGFIKGKAAMHIAQNFGGRKKNFVGQHFWARGYHVSTVGRDEATIREYIRNQEKEDQRLDQMHLFK
jgi:putative transposase